MKIRKALAIISAFALIAIACGGDGDGGFRPQIRTTYLEGCQSVQTAEFCECTLEKFEDTFSEESFIRFAIEATEEPPREFIEVGFACRDQADLGD